LFKAFHQVTVRRDQVLISLIAGLILFFPGIVLGQQSNVAQNEVSGIKVHRKKREVSLGNHPIMNRPLFFVVVKAGVVRPPVCALN